MTDGRSDLRQYDAGVELPYAGVESFLDAPVAELPDVLDPETPPRAAEFDAGVLGVPFDGGVSNRPGARYGPRGVRRASGWLAYLSGYKGGLTNVRTRRQVDYSNLDVVDCGDVPVFPMDYERTRDSVAAHVAALSEELFPVVVGGDHSCTAAAFRGFVEGGRHDSVGLVQIDAHADTSTESPVFGESFHGSSTAEIATSAGGSYETVVQVGIRGYEGPEFFSFAEETGLTVHTMPEVSNRGVATVVEEAVTEAAIDTDAVYVTFDIDAVDPSAAPGTGTPEPGGLTPSQALTVVETLGRSDDVGAVDLMEVAPESDPTNQTSRLAAYLLVTLLERRFAE
jgi:agmatinase